MSVTIQVKHYLFLTFFQWLVVPQRPLQVFERWQHLDHQVGYNDILIHRVLTLFASDEESPAAQIKRKSWVFPQNSKPSTVTHPHGFSSDVIYFLESLNNPAGPGGDIDGNIPDINEEDDIQEDDIPAIK